MKVQPDCKHSIDGLANSLSDNDNEWWPFLSLRPETDQQLTWLRCLALTGLYCVPAVLVAALTGALFSAAVPSLPTLLALIAGVWTAALVAFRWGVAGPWNRRANDLHKNRRRRDQWMAQRSGSEKPSA